MSALIVFKTLTQAQLAVRFLSDNGIPVNVIKAPRSLEEKGCAYAVRMTDHRLGTAVNALRENRWPFGRVYRSDGAGVYREVFP